MPHQREVHLELVARVAEPLRRDVARDDEREIVVEPLDRRVQRVGVRVLEHPAPGGESSAVSFRKCSPGEIGVLHPGGEVRDDLFHRGAVEGAAADRGAHHREAEGT